jgi:cytochrome c peroxidase
MTDATSKTRRTSGAGLGLVQSIALAGALFAATAGAVAQTAPVSIAGILGVDPTALKTMMAGYARPSDIPSPEHNPTTAEKVKLGKMLFFDPRLSGSGAISCATCHNPSLGWQDGLPTAVGDKGGILGRHTPTILNAAWMEPLFWDGRANTLEEQALGPIMAQAEMAGSPKKVLETLNNVQFYREEMARVFPHEPLSLETAAKAIAAYERTVVSGEAPFDRWIKGNDTAISDSAKRGFVLFNTKGNCAVCHAGWRFADDGFHDIGLPGNDMGRAAVLPGIVQLERAFKTPTLRNIAERGPYMHDGSIATLEGVVDHYDESFVRRPSLDAEMKSLKLTDQEKADIVAFMKTLSSDDAPVDMPILPR